MHLTFVLQIKSDLKYLETLMFLQNEMKIFLAKIVNLMKEEKLFASQGGPIILAQVHSLILFIGVNMVISNEWLMSLIIQKPLFRSENYIASRGFQL